MPERTRLVAVVDKVGPRDEIGYQISVIRYQEPATSYRRSATRMVQRLFLVAEVKRISDISNQISGGGRKKEAGGGRGRRVGHLATQDADKDACVTKATPRERPQAKAYAT